MITEYLYSDFLKVLPVPEALPGEFLLEITQHDSLDSWIVDSYKDRNVNLALMSLIRWMNDVRRIDNPGVHYDSILSFDMILDIYDPPFPRKLARFNKYFCELMGVPDTKLELMAFHSSYVLHCTFNSTTDLVLAKLIW